MRERERFSVGSKVFAVVPVHNRWEQTRQCLLGLRNQTFPNLRTFVVDDGSTDGTKKNLEAEFPEVAVVPGDGTLWWAGGVNRGMEAALREASEEDFLLIVNNDLSFDDDFLSRLCRESVERGRASLAPVSRDRRTGETVDCGLIVDWKAGKIVSAERSGGRGRTREPDAFSTRGLLLPVPVATGAGLLREKDLPHYLSDVEYTLRIRKLGFPIHRAESAFATLDTATTGLKVKPGTSSSWQEIRDHFFDYRSPSNIIHWMRFLRICCPRKYLPRWIRKVTAAEMKFVVKAILARERK